MFDIQSVGKLCREKGILFVVDTAQSAGVIPISMKEDNIDILCFTGHKGLMGPQGIGGICIRKGVEIRPLNTGGTGIGLYNIKTVIKKMKGTICAENATPSGAKFIIEMP